MPTPKAITDMGSILITVSRDTTAPGLPGVPTPVSNTLTTITLDWTAALDNAGGSGIKGYDVERNGAVIATQVPKSYTDTGLSSSTSYTYRIRAVDNAGNVGNFGSSASLSTAGLNLGPAWNATPAPIFVQGTASSFSLVGIASDPESDPITFSVIAGTLPTGVTLNNTTKALDYNGVGAATTASGIRLRASSTGGTADSSIFSVQISASANSAAAQADWLKRSTAPGVVWAHDFRSQAEVTNFLFPGSDTSKNVWRTDDGITGGCYEAFVPAGGQHGGGWERPFSPLNSGGNGLAVGDAACAGTLTRKTWTPSSSQLGNWADGYYCHPDYLNTGLARDPGPSSVYKADSIPGRDFYIQFRVKMPASRFAAGQPDGKLVMILTTGDGPIPAGLGTAQPRTGNQELVIKSNPSALYQMYTNFGNRSNSYLTSTQGSSGTGQYQPGADYGATCVIGNTTTNTCWSFPADEWVTVLVHIIPGHDGGGGNEPVVAGNSANDTTVEVWVARANEWEYTKIWEKKDYVWSFGQNDPWPRGFNSFAFNAFMNQVNATQAFYHRYTQVIFSRQYVPCPQPIGATAPAWVSGLSTNTVVHLGSAVGKRWIDAAPTTLPAGYDFGSKFSAWTSMAVDPQTGRLISAAKGGHTDSSGNDVIAFELRADSPGAVRLTNPTISVDTTDIEFSGAGSAYSDGKIRSNHGWNCDHWLARRLWTFGPEGTYSNGRRQTEAWTFDLRSLGNGPFPVSSSAAPWARHGDPMPTKGGNMETQGGPSAPDPVTWSMWRVANVGSNANGQSLWSMHASTKVAKQYAVTLGSVGNGNAAWMVIAPDKRIGIIGMNQGYLVLFNPDNPVATWRQSTPTGTGAYGNGTGAVYDQRSGKVYAYDKGGNTVRVLTIPSNPLTGTYSWSPVTFGGATISATTPAGSFNKFNILDDVGNGQPILVWAQTYSEGTYSVLLNSTGL
jgi:hypothetical protein